MNRFISPSCSLGPVLDHTDAHVLATHPSAVKGQVYNAEEAVGAVGVQLRPKYRL